MSNQLLRCVACVRQKTQKEWSLVAESAASRAGLMTRRSARHRSTRPPPVKRRMIFVAQDQRHSGAWGLSISNGDLGLGLRSMILPPLSERELRKIAMTPAYDRQYAEGPNARSIILRPSSHLYRFPCFVFLVSSIPSMVAQNIETMPAAEELFFLRGMDSPGIPFLDLAGGTVGDMFERQAPMVVFPASLWMRLAEGPVEKVRR